MDFFEHQDRSRRKSRWLVGAFLLAVVAIVLAVDFLVVFFVGRSGPPGVGLTGVVRENAGTLALVTAVTTAAILGASLLRIAQLRDGGGAVARGLGAVPVPDNPEDFRLRRFRNVVEETALASGLPVPELFILEQETGINAFAAGHGPSDAAVAVTRGAVEKLSRNELQGVIAHEFSHVANGDMRLSLRLMGWLFGILVIAMAGRAILRAGIHGGRRNRGNALAVFGIGLVVVGYVGVFAGRVIKAAVSRERERLADASAVQFTRDTTGLAGALKKIGGLGEGSELRHADAEEVSHMLFAEGLSSRLLATHPPLMERILALDPSFRAEQFSQVAVGAGDEAAETDALGQPPPSLAAVTPAGFVAAAGQPGDEQFRSGGALRRAIPEPLYRAAHEEIAAPEVVTAMLLSSDASVRERQVSILESRLGPEAANRAADVAGEAGNLAPGLRMTLVDLAWPRLRHLPAERLGALSRTVQQLARADGRVEVFEYALARRVRVLVRDLADGGDRPALKLTQCPAELADLFAVMARAGHEGEVAARRAYEAGLSSLLRRERPEFRVPADWQSALDHALDRLDALPAVIKRELLRALATTVGHDERLAPAEAELLRAVSASLHCPVPPLPLTS